MTAIVRPPFGKEYRITGRGYIEGFFYRGGRRIRRDLGPVRGVLMDGKGRRRSTGQLDRAIMALWDAKRDQLQAEAEGSAPERRRIGEVMGDWIKAAETGGKAKATLANHYRPLKAAWLAAVGDHPLAELSLREVDAFKAHLHGKKNNATTINLKLGKLQTFLRWAQRRGYLAAVPEIERLPRERKLPQIPDEASLGKLLRRVHELATREPVRRKHPEPERTRRYLYELHELMLLMVLGTAMRRGEVYHRPWAEVFLENGLVLVRGTKERADKLVVLPAWLVAYLDRRRKRYPGHVWLFDNGKGEPIYTDPRAMTKALRRHLDSDDVGLASSKVKPIHGLRANLATIGLDELGIPITEVQQILGHANVATTEAAYLARRTAEKRRAMAALEAGYFPRLGLDGILTEGPKPRAAEVRAKRA